MTYVEEIGTDFDPVSPRLAADFYPSMAALRDKYPVLRSSARDGSVSVSRFADVRGVLQDWHTFTSAQGVTPVAWQRELRMLPLEVDPPFHRRLRELLNPYFTEQRAKAMRPRIEEIINEVMDAVTSRGECEFVHEVASQIPKRVVFGEVLGGPLDEMDVVLSWVTALLTDPDGAADAAVKYRDWANRLLDERRSRGERREDCIDAFVFGQVDGRSLTETESLGLMLLVTMAALDSTEMAMTNICLRLAQDPSLRARLREGDEALRRRAIEEILRFDTPVPLLSRVATCPHAFDGGEVETGERVMTWISAANHDPAVFDDPERLDIDRPNVNDHIAFGWGVHKCIGRHVARVELLVCTELILSRMSDLRLQPDFEIEYKPGMSRRPLALNVEFTPS